MHTGERPPSSEENEKKRVGRVDREFRFNPHAQREGKAWPQTLKWRGKAFVLHYDNGDGTALYDAPSGPAEGEVIIDREGFVLGGHDGKFEKWPIVEEELDL